MSDADTNLRARTARALRAAADAIERGEMPAQVDPMMWSTEHAWEDWATLEQAQARTEQGIEMGDDSWREDSRSIRWGVFVAVELACVEVIDTEEAREKARELGEGDGEWWEVSLVDAWKEAE